MKIAYLILAHQHPVLLARLIRRLLAADGMVVVHFDRKAGDAAVSELRALLGPDYERLIWVDRVAVVWGEWSLVEATLHGLKAIAAAEQQPDYVYLLSGADYPVRPLHELKEFLARNSGKEFIESFCDRQHIWVKQGIQTERYLYRFPFNWGRHPRLFALSLRLQKLLRWKRQVPAGVDPHFGSQWWVLTWTSCAAILKYCEDRKLLRFFQRSWVPDELIFQTLIRRIAEQGTIRSHTLTLYQFTDSGTPVVYCNGHEEYLARQNFFFARKISPWAERLRDKLDELSDGDREPYRFADQNIGKLTADYQRHFQVYGQTVYGRQVIGRVNEDGFGDLDWNRKPYYLVAGFSFREIKAFQDYLNSLGGILCHGQLFHPVHIDFIDYVERYAGLSRHDVSLRDNNIGNFLTQILHEEGDRQPGFLVNLRTQFKVLSQLAGDPNARVIVLDGNPLQAFLESPDAGHIPESGPDQAHAGLLDRQEWLPGQFVRYYETVRKKLYLLNSLLEERNNGVLYLNTGQPPPDTLLTARYLDDFYHNRLTGFPNDAGAGQALRFSTGLELPAEYDFLQDVKEAVDQTIAEKILEMGELEIEDLSS